MKRHMTIRTTAWLLLSALFIAVTPASMSAQEYIAPEVTISKEKVKVDGVICYSHIVLEKQTLYSISKAYNVSIDDIYRFNPSLKETGLRKNSIIIIPSADAMVKSHQPSSDRQARLDSLTSQESSSAPLSAERPSERTHVVKWYEDIETIAQKYNVTAESILEANNLKGKKLKSRMKIVIPDSSHSQFQGTEQNDNQQAQTGLGETIIEKVEDIKNAIIEKTEEIFSKKKVNASLLLPLKAMNGTSSRNNMDFYCGALMAVYDMAEKGISTDLSVYDIAEGAQVTRSQIENSDVIIGPVSSGDITRLFAQAPADAKVVSPLDPRAENLTAQHRNMVQAPTPQRMQYADLAKWISEDIRKGDKIIMISEKGARQSQNTMELKTAADSARLSYIPFSYSILEGRDITEALSGLMSQDGTNRFIIASESEAFVNDAVRNLNLLAHLKFDVVLYAPSKIKSFDNIDIENFHNTNLHVSATYNIDYEDEMVKEFLKRYRALFNTEPNQYAFQGYDVTRFFVEMAARYGKDWIEHLTETEEPMLQSTFKFRRVGHGGLVNSGTRRLIYGDDWSVKQVK